MTIPKQPKIYHIVHLDRLDSIINDGGLYSDVSLDNHASIGTSIGMAHIKERRRCTELASRPGLYVGECVPFYFCPRSVMLYLINNGSEPELPYRGPQSDIIHLEADLYSAINYAEQIQKRWAFTLSNAGSSYFEDRCSTNELIEIDWDAVNASYWRDVKEKKQAEFLIEQKFPWDYVERIGVYSNEVRERVNQILTTQTQTTAVEVKRDWYY